jgi:tetratricopeptide (TPR) repeat protein
VRPGGPVTLIHGWAGRRCATDRSDTTCRLSAGLDGLVRSGDHDPPYSYNQTSGTNPAPPAVSAPVRESAARNGVAAEMFGAGRYDEAVPLFEQALSTCRSALGRDHPDTMTVAGNLGVAYFAAGQRRKGLKLIADNVAARVRVLGEEHPNTLTARNALAAAHRLAGDADTAIALAKQVVVQRSRTLGSAHFDTLSSRMNLALALAAAGDVASAHRILASTMDDAEETFGARHTHTLVLLECGVSHGLLREEPYAQ